MLECWIDTRLIYTSRGFTGFVHCTFQAFVTFIRTDAAHLSRTHEALVAQASLPGSTATHHLLSRESVQVLGLTFHSSSL